MLSNNGLCLRTATTIFIRFNNSNRFQIYGVACSYSSCPLLCALDYIIIVLGPDITTISFISPPTHPPPPTHTHTQHLNVLKEHKNNIYEINLPNKVTKIMATPMKGTVRRAIEPTLKTHGFSLDIMELRFANTFKVCQRERGREGAQVFILNGKVLLCNWIYVLNYKCISRESTFVIMLLFVISMKSASSLQHS